MDFGDIENEMGDTTEDLNTLIYKDEAGMETGEVAKAPIEPEAMPKKEVFSVRKPAKKKKKVSGPWL